MVGRQGALHRELAWRREQLRGKDVAAGTLHGFLNGLLAGVLVGAVLVLLLLLLRRFPGDKDAPASEASIELKGRAAQIIGRAREGAETVVARTGDLQSRASETLNRVLPSAKDEQG